VDENSAGTLFADATERALLGCVLFGGKNVAEKLATDIGLTPAHFYRHDYGALYADILAVIDGGDDVDSLIVSGKSHWSLGELESLVASAGVLGHYPSYASRVIELANLRRVKQAGLHLVAGAQAEDQTQIAKGEALLSAPVGNRRETFDASELAEQLYVMLDSGKPETFSWPFGRFDRITNGGMRRGQVTLIGGHSSHGKSAWLDQTLTSAAAGGRKVHLFINEMTPLERTIRTVARMTGVPMAQISMNDLKPDERATVLEALPKIPYGITDCAGWAIEDVARIMRRNPFDVVGIDILHLFDYSDEADLRRISRIINAASKQASCHVLATVHLNENRVRNAPGQAAIRPAPTLGDIRGSGSLKNDADSVLFVHRTQDEETGRPEAQGAIYFAKGRGHALGGANVMFDPHAMKFLEAVDAAQ